MGLTSDELVRGDSLAEPRQHDLRDSLLGTAKFDFHGIMHVVNAFTDEDYSIPDGGTFKLEVKGFGIVYTCGTYWLGRSWLTAVDDSLNELIAAAIKATDQPGFIKDGYKNCLPKADHEQVQNDDGSWDIGAVDVQPEFPGGFDRLLQHMAKVQQYPDSELKAGVEGTVYVRFTVEEDGSLVDIKILRSISPGLDREAMRLIESMPNWTPAKVKDQTVRCRVTLPIHFKLGTQEQ